VAAAALAAVDLEEAVALAAVEAAASVGLEAAALAAAAQVAAGKITSNNIIMYKKDFIESEVHKLGEVLARILGLKKEGKLDEALEVSAQTLSNTFGFNQDLIEKGSIEDFQNRVKAENMGPEKLNLLAQLLFEHAHPFQETEESIAKARKVALVLNLLETEYHQQSLQNLSRREAIDNFLSNLQYE
jgi:hypothetical protein